MSSTPHVKLHHGYLEPLARPIRPTTQATIPAPCAPASHALPPRLERLTSRLAVQSQWLARSERERSRCGRSPEADEPLRVALSSSQYSTSGTWPPSPRPQATVVRKAESTLLQRRLGVPTSRWHSPPSPDSSPKTRASPEEELAWRKRWERVSHMDVRSRADKVRQELFAAAS
jgi:hypothetical protein